jgi:hypothetical protein
MPDARKTKGPRPLSGTSTKDPEQDAEHPASMPCDQQGQGGTPKQNDPAGQQGGYHESPSRSG